MYLDVWRSLSQPISLGIYAESVRHFSIHKIEYSQPAIAHEAWVFSTATYDTVLLCTTNLRIGTSQSESVSCALCHMTTITSKCN